MKLEKIAEKTIVIIGLLIFAIFGILFISLSNYAMLFWGLLIIPIYFIPAYIAYKKNHKYKLQILLLDLFLGFTYVGWAVALIWATTDNNKA